jgi:signal transduction histidine kinase/ActR/RegA family two-component response regulator
MSMFKKQWVQVKNQIWDIIASGLPDDFDIDILRKIILLNLIIIVGSFFLGLLSIIAAAEGDRFLASIDLSLALFLILLLLILRKKKNFRFIGLLGLTTVGLFFLFLIAYGSITNVKYLWTLVYPIVTLSLLGKKVGTGFSFSFLVLSAILIQWTLNLPQVDRYNISFLIRFISAYITIFLLSFVAEMIHEKVYRKLTESKNALQVSYRKEQESSLHLTHVNERLVAEIDERKRLERQLFQAQKMEAVGTLAGGVAHDLNNVLSGIVSYPELILMDLPEKSPIKGPIQTIQKSGQKAAAIVQDLLTLARRAVPVNDVVNLNDMVESFVESPEYGNIKKFHPTLEIETSLEPDLLNIVGSPVHLFKTLMNLVSNGAESMGKGGLIRIETVNQALLRTKIGYEKIPAGDYVVLSVADSGIGISTEDIQKIFEPFYTKKSMGRSGTGLGMTVVWGTIKDLNGYVDVQSMPGSGTRFSLYFPATSQKRFRRDIGASIDAYKGKEKILLVDDVPEQREIGSAMLRKLGYSVHAVSSGEQSIEYVEENPVDLIILDMVMDPGLDGLDTYKEITKRIPAQKAIIASGFSKTERVKGAQQLGVGGYVRKPYTLEKIGMAVRSELDKPAARQVA